MVEAIQFTSAAECIAHAAEMRTKFYGRNAPVKVEPKPEPPVVKIVTKEPVKRVKKPLWKTVPSLFDEHVVMYRIAVRLAQLEASGAIDVKVGFRKPMLMIVNEVLERFPDVTIGEIKGPRRTKRVVSARMEAAYQLHVQRPDLSYPAIGRWMGGKDHTTIIHAVRTIAARRAGE